MTANYLAVSSLAGFQAGDDLTQRAIDAKARVAAMGANIATDPFDGANPIGSEIKVGGASYEWPAASRPQWV